MRGRKLNWRPRVPDGFLGINDAAEKTGVSECQIRYMIRTGLLSLRKGKANMFLFSKDDIRRLYAAKAIITAGFSYEDMAADVCGMTLLDAATDGDEEVLSMLYERIHRGHEEAIKALKELGHNEG